MSSETEKRESPIFKKFLRHYLRPMFKDTESPIVPGSNDLTALTVSLFLLTQQKLKVSSLQAAALKYEERLTRMSKSLKRWKALAKRAGRCAREWETTAACYQDALRAKETANTTWVRWIARETNLPASWQTESDQKVAMNIVVELLETRTRCDALSKTLAVAQIRAAAPAPVASADTIEALARLGHNEFRNYCQERGLGVATFDALSPTAKDAFCQGFVTAILRAVKPEIDVDKDQIQDCLDHYSSDQAGDILHLCNSHIRWTYPTYTADDVEALAKVLVESFFGNDFRSAARAAIAWFGWRVEE